MKIKDGVRLGGLRVEMCIAILVAQSVYDRFSEDFVITCALEGIHMKGSLHYVGAAVDLRLPLKRRQQIRRNIAERLGDDYDVVLGRSHIHIEFQPKVAVNVNAG